jgi:hypothetical protein
MIKINRTHQQFTEKIRDNTMPGQKEDEETTHIRLNMRGFQEISIGKLN